MGGGRTAAAAVRGPVIVLLNKQPWFITLTRTGQSALLGPGEPVAGSPAMIGSSGDGVRLQRGLR